MGLGLLTLRGALRDLLAQRWLLTRRTYDRENAKQVYYLSMEFLLGRSLTNNLTNLLVEPIVRDIIQRAGLGNSGLGRLAACFIDSLATLQIPAIGYGLRYHYGIFRQDIQNGYMAVAELMHILLDQAGLGWDEAWNLTTRRLAYTNHTLLPEALEKWPVELFEMMLPRQLEIIYEINRRFLDTLRTCFPGDDARTARMSLIEETPIKQARMANLAIVGSHSTNGVAAIHSELLRATVVKDFADMFPERFNNKTNGVTPRRWLLLANPDFPRQN
jgi:glucan phosphorylase